MKNQKESDTLLSLLEKSIESAKSYDDIVQDGASMERLKANPDFEVYQKLIREHYLDLCSRIRLVNHEDLPRIQGIIAEAYTLMDLPNKVFLAASRAVADKRREMEALR